MHQQIKLSYRRGPESGEDDGRGEEDILCGAWRR